LRVGKTKEAPKEWQNWESQYHEALEILGPDRAFGPEAVEKTFGIKLEYKDIPPIPFTGEELERAKELGQLLIRRVDKAADGKPLTMKKMSELVSPRFAKEGKGKVLIDTDGYQNEEFDSKESPVLRWALVSKEIVPSSTSKDYVQQTETIIDYLKTQVFKDQPISEQYQVAFQEFESQKAQIVGLISSNDRQKAAELLEALKITELTHQTPAEALYDTLVRYETANVCHFQNKIAWTRRRSSDGRLVGVGGFGADGLRVGGSDPDFSNPVLGVALSR
jgi:hypothetical protein